MWLKWKPWKGYNFCVLQFDSNHLLQGLKIVSSVFAHPRAQWKGSKGVFETSPVSTWKGKWVWAFTAAWQLLLWDSSCTVPGGKWPFSFITAFLPWFKRVKEKFALVPLKMDWPSLCSTEPTFTDWQLILSVQKSHCSNICLTTKPSVPSWRKNTFSFFFLPPASFPGVPLQLFSHETIAGFRLTPKEESTTQNHIPSGFPRQEHSPCLLACSTGELPVAPGRMCPLGLCTCALGFPSDPDGDKCLWEEKVSAPSKFLHHALMEAEQPDKQQWGVAVVSGKYSQWTSNFSWQLFYFFVIFFSCTQLNALNWLW